MLSKEIRQLAFNLDSLRRFSKFLGPYIDEQIREQFEVKTGAAPLRFIFQQLQAFYAGEAYAEEDQDSHTQITEIAKKEDSKSVTVSYRVSDSLADEYEETITELRRLSHYRQHLLDSSLISLVSTVEWFLSQILHTYYREVPDALKETDKTFSLEDLRRFASMEAARDVLIDKKIESSLRGGFEDWCKEIRSCCNLSMGYVDEHRAVITEAFQRRNLLVHNGGVINSIYIDHVDEALREGLDVGSRIDVGPSYLGHVIDVCEVVFSLIGAELWKKLRPDDDGRTMLVNIAFEHLKEKRWAVAESISRFSMNDKGMKGDTISNAELNFWQAVKWQERFAEVEEDVRMKDYSAHGDLYQLARLALLDQFVEVVARAEDLVARGVIQKWKIQEWPIFSGVRSSPEYCASAVFCDTPSGEVIEEAS